MQKKPQKPKKPQKRPTSEETAIPDREHDPQARIIHQLVRQLEPHLPIDSFEKIAEKLTEVVVDKHRLPLKLFAPHISNDLFPIRTTEDLEQKLSAGVRRAVFLSLSDSISVRNMSLTEILERNFLGPVGKLGMNIGVSNITTLDLTSNP